MIKTFLFCSKTSNGWLVPGMEFLGTVRTYS
jgi:hypothetical protein